MAWINNLDWVNETAELESSKKESIFNKFLSDFSKNYFTWDKKNEKIDELFNKNELTPDIKSKMEEFRSLSNSEFSEWVSPVDIEKVTTYDLRNKVITTYVDLKNRRDNLFDIFSNQFDLSDNESNLKDLINNLSDFELNNLSKNTEKRNKYINKNIPNINKKEDLIKDFFWQFNILNEYSDLPENKKEVIRTLFNNDWTLKKIDYSVISDLFEADVFTLDEKKKIVKFFIPTISLVDIRNFNLFWNKTEDFIINKKNEISNKVLSKLSNNEELSDEKKQFIISSIDEDKFKITTSDIVSEISNDDLNTIVDNLNLKDFTDTYNNFLEEINSKEWNDNFPNWKDSFIEKLNEFKNVDWIENFKEDSYIVLSLTAESDKKMDKNVTKQFFKIKDLDTWNFWMWLIDMWFPNIDFSKTDKGEFFYTNFLNSIKKWINLHWEKYEVAKCSFMSKEIIESEIKKWAIEESWIWEKTQTELDKSRKISLLESENDKIKIEIINELHKTDECSQIINEIDDISLEISGLNKVISDLENKWEDTSEFNRRLDLLKNRKELKEDELRTIENIFLINNLEDLGLNEDSKLYSLIKEYDDNKWEIKNIEDLSEEELITILNEFDSDWKIYWFEVWTSFYSKDGVFTVDKIDSENKTIDIYSINWISTNITFQQFIDTFKDIKAKRASSSKDCSSIVNNISWDSKLDSKTTDKWNEFEFKDGGIYKKWSTKDIEYDYFKWKDGDLVYVNNYSWDKVNISFWEYKDSGKDENWNKTKEKSFSMYNDTPSMTVSVSRFEAWLKREDWIPASLNEYKDVEDNNLKWADIKWSFWSRYFSRVAISEVMSGLKLWLDSIEWYLKEWSDEKAALAAQWIYWNLLPEQLRYDLMSRVEESQKKRADDYVSKLNNVDSRKASEMIAWWLLNKNSPEYLKEAWVSFMLQKYWVLYAKSWLNPYKWKFLYYESMWWKIGDEFYNQIKKEAEDNWENFREEDLIFKFIKKQCWSSWFKWVKRRSRFHKEVKKFRAIWKQEEYETWKWDAKDERTFEWRLWWAMWELLWGTYPNWVGWLEEAINKWASMEDMNMVPFVMSFSGMAYTFEQNTLDQLKNFPAQSRMIPMLRFMSLNKDMHLLNDTILRICERYKEVKWDKAWSIYEDALDIFAHQETNTRDEFTKGKKTEKFYKKHWEIITNILYSLNTWDTSEDSYLSKMILIEKDDHKNSDWEIVKWDSTFKRYSDLLWMYVGEFSWWDDDLYSDAFAWAWTSWVSIQKATKTLLEQSQGWGYRNKNAWPIMWEEIKKEINAIVERDYWIYWELWKEKDLDNLLKWFISGLLEAHGTNVNALSSFVSGNSSAFASQMREWGIDLTKIMRYSYVDVNNWRADLLVTEYRKILLWENEWDSWSKFDETIFKVKSDVENNT